MRARLYGAWWHGVLLGLLATMAGLAVGELVAGLARSASSAVLPVGQEVIDRVPPWLKDWAIDTFGTADKAVLVVGTIVVLGIIGSLVGILTVRGHLGPAVLLTVVVGLVGVSAVLARPAPSLVRLLPAILGTATSVLVLVLLAPRPADGTDDTAPAGDRRRFVIAGLATAAVALVAGVVGRRLQGRFEVDDEREALALPGADPAPVPVDAELPVAGLTPFITPNDRFYRIDTALRVPQVRAAEWRLRVHGMVDRELELTLDDLFDRPVVERVITLSCVSNEVGGDLVGNAAWRGVLLADVLREAGVQDGAEQLVSRSTDGWTCGTPVGAVLDGRDAMLAFGMNGEPLPARHGYPVRMVVPGLFGYVSATKWVTDVELTTWDAFDAYWVPRGWAKQAPVKTMTRIDRPRRGSVPGGPYDVGGVAWAVHRGLGSVEVRIDGRSWQEAELAGVPSDDTWRQ
ncbi:MAG: molybdopterin-dependent oxidoreductase, partial [Ilumatobacteraceae bacterium]|nr:molybdopterin-dependent oxidoreductase [Ilumatobacteraceae bacterium]